MAAAPGVATYACPDCGSTDWATTTAFILDRKSALDLLPWVVGILSLGLGLIAFVVLMKVAAQ
jgi:hypothetical protein